MVSLVHARHTLIFKTHTALMPLTVRPHTHHARAEHVKGEVEVEVEVEVELVWAGSATLPRECVK
jgi:hypothetical protein